MSEQRAKVLPFPSRPRAEVVVSEHVRATSSPPPAAELPGDRWGFVGVGLFVASLLGFVVALFVGLGIIL